MTPCVLWTRSQNGHGYGKLSLGGRIVAAHRAVYEERIGPIPAGLMVLHHCDTRSCINPAHLFLGTARDNAMDAVAKGRWKSNPPKGERSPNAKVTAREVLAIRERHRNGESFASLARDYGIS